jgi:hypothetical protein
MYVTFICVTDFPYGERTSIIGRGNGFRRMVDAHRGDWAIVFSNTGDMLSSSVIAIHVPVRSANYREANRRSEADTRNRLRDDPFKCGTLLITICT